MGITAQGPPFVFHIHFDLFDSLAHIFKSCFRIISQLDASTFAFISSKFYLDDMDVCVGLEGWGMQSYKAVKSNVCVRMYVCVCVGMVEIVCQCG